MGRVVVAVLGAFAVGVALLIVFVSVVASVVSPVGGLFGRGRPGVVCAPAGGGAGQPVAGFANDQLANAALIVAAGDEMRVPQRGQVIAVATAMQESGLHNLDHGDRDSVGLFQQRASWGSLATRMDPKASAKLFYARLLAIPGWQSLPLTLAAQRVQVSALPDAYAKWEAKAEQVVGSVLGISCQPSSPTQPGSPAPGAPPPPGVQPSDPQAAAVLARAVSQVGVPYAWGGGNSSGPTRGISDGGGPADQAGDSRKTGFDCSGLMVYAFAAAGITVPHQTQAIWASFAPPITDRGQLQPGDIILTSNNGQPSGIDHAGLYLGGGRVVDAPESGTTVRIEPDVWANPWWSAHFIGAVRPLGSGPSRTS
jgi:cell wall-associated NlpC family hydrolase